MKTNRTPAAAPATAAAPAAVTSAPVLDGKAIYIPAPRRKSLSAANVPALVGRYIVGADDSLVRPSDIRLSVSVLKAGMGAAASLDSFINGLAGISARLAWGAITAAQAADGLPDFAAWAVHQADRAIVSRKGISAGLLRTLVADVVTRTAALPIRTAPAKAKAVRTLSAPAQADAAPAAVDKVAALAELARMTRAAADAPINTRDAIPHQITEAEAAEASAALVASAARTKAEAEASAAAAAARKAEAEDRALAELTAAGQSAHLRAVAFCRLADAIGIKLTKAQLAALDAFEGKRTKVPA